MISRFALIAVASIACSQTPPQGSATAAASSTPQRSTASTAAAKTAVQGKLTVPADAVPAGSDARQVSVTSEKVAIAQPRDLSSALAARGVQATPEAIAAIYDLNPTLDDIRNIKPGTSLVLPKVTGDLRMREAIGRGSQIRIVSEDNTNTIKSVTATHAQLMALSERVPNIQPNRFRVAADRARFIRSFTNGQQLIQRTLTGGYPLAQKVLRQTALNAKIMHTVAQAALGPGEPLPTGPADAIDDQVDSPAVNQVQDAERSQQAIVTDLAAGGSGLGLVQVQTVKIVNGAQQPVPGLRVTYAPKLDPTSTTTFANLTSPVSETLVVGADFTFTVPGGDTPITRRIDKTSNPITFTIVR